MNKALTLIKQGVLIAVPVSLVFSIYINSLVIIVVFFLFLPDFYKNFRQNNSIKNRKVLFVFLTFVMVYLIGICIDVFYGTANFRESERLLSFIIFPLIFLFSNAIDVFEDEKTPIKVFGVFIVFFNLFLIFNLFTKTFIDYNDNSFSNERWEKSNVEVKDNDNEPNQIFPVSEILIKKMATRPDLIFEHPFSLCSDTLLTRSVYVKSNDDVWVLLRQFDGKTHKGAWFHPKTTTLGFVQKQIKARIEPLENGWSRISVTNRVSANTSRERLQITFVNKDKGYRIETNEEYRVLMGGAQLEISNLASDYKPLKHRSFFEGFDRTKILNSVNGHPTYYSLYILLSCLVVMLFIRAWYVQLFYLIINITTLILLGSKAAILSFFILFILFLFINWRTQNSKMKVLFVILPISILAVLFFSNTMHRFSQSVNSVTNSNDSVYLSTDKRIEMWKSVGDLPFINLMIGSGNVHGYEMLSTRTELTLNSHNQYLEAILSAGVLGLLLLLFFVGGVFFVDHSARKNQLLILFAVMVGFNLFFENLLNRQWGIVFIAFFLSYIYKLGEVNE